MLDSRGSRSRVVLCLTSIKGGAVNRLSDGRARVPEQAAVALFRDTVYDAKAQAVLSSMVTVTCSPSRVMAGTSAFIRLPFTSTVTERRAP